MASMFGPGKGRQELDSDEAQYAPIAHRIRRYGQDAA